MSHDDRIVGNVSADQGRLAKDNEQIDESMKESGEQRGRAVDQADTGLWTGQVLGPPGEPPVGEPAVPVSRPRFELDEVADVETVTQAHIEANREAIKKPGQRCSRRRATRSTDGRRRYPCARCPTSTLDGAPRRGRPGRLPTRRAG